VETGLDFRRLNNKISQEFVPIINVNQVSHMISKAVHPGQGHDTKNDHPKQLLFSTFDLTSAFFQTPLTPESRQFTAFSTRTRRLEFLRVPLGLRISSGAFISALCSVFANEIAAHSLALYVDDAILCQFHLLGPPGTVTSHFPEAQDSQFTHQPQKEHFCSGISDIFGLCL
jgi:hypothetical protein